MYRTMLFWFMLPAVAMAQAPQAGWKPDRPVELVIGAAPSGANDRIGRAIQRVLQGSRIVSVPVNVLNKPGGGQAIAFAYLNTHPSNPHYLGLASSSWLTTIAGKRGSTDHRDVTPVVKILDEYQVYFVRADSPIKTARDIIEQLRKDPASLAFGFSTRHPGALASVPTLREQGIDVDASVFYTIFGPRGLTPAQTEYWDQAISQVMQGPDIRKNVEQNYWTIGLIGHRELPQFLDREIENYRRALTEMGLM